MAKLSRTQKYQELRDALDEETTQAQAAPVVGSRLTRTQNASNTLPHAAKALFPHEENQAAPNTKEFVSSPVMDELLGEVKQYNIDNGNRYTDDTQINILKQLDNPAADTIRRTAHVLPMEEEEEVSGTTMELPRQGKVVLSSTDILADDRAETDNLDVLSTSLDTEEIEEEFPVREKKKKERKEKKKEKKQRQRQEEEMPSAKMRMRAEDFESELPAKKQKQSGRFLNIVLVILLLFGAIAAMVLVIKNMGIL